MRLRLVRHGESTANAGLVTQTPQGSPLTEKGRSQAQAFADTFDHPPASIISSPFQRALETAAPLAKRFDKRPVIHQIQEWNFLDSAKYAGTTWQDRQPHVQAYMRTASADFRDGPAESFNDLLARVRDFLEAMTKIDAGDAVAFSHGRFIKAVMWCLGDHQRNVRSYWEFSEHHEVDNVSVTELEFTCSWKLL